MNLIKIIEMLYSIHKDPVNIQIDPVNIHFDKILMV